jgi:tetratricopeptide (TPR) repeat protein
MISVVKIEHRTRRNPTMYRKTTFLLFALLILSLAALPTLAQDEEATPVPTPEEPRYVCPAFPDESAAERTSYYMGEGAAFMRSGNYAAAINSYGCIVQQIDDGYRDAYLNRAAAYAARREYDEALDDYNAAIRIDGSFAPAYNNRGVIYALIQEYEEAMSDLDQAVSINSGYVLGYLNRGVVQAAQGNYEAAIADFEQVVDLEGLDGVVAELRDPERESDAPTPEYSRDAALAYALIGAVRSQQALADYQDYLLLLGSSADSRISSAAGSLESRFNFELRFDDGGFLLLDDFIN